MIARLAAASSIAVAAAFVLMGGGERPSEAVFPGTNGKIAFANFTNNDTEIWTMNPDGSGRTKLTNTQDGIASQPAFSPDGEMIGFVLNSLSEPRGLYTMGAGGGASSMIPNTGISDIDLTWAPGGDKIAFERLSGPSEIYSVNLDGTELTNLTNTVSLGEGSPDWSPLGDRIAFGGGDIWVMDDDGGNKMNLTNTPATFEDNPDWSPDGSRLIFDSYTPPAAGAAGLLGNRDIAVINTDGTGFQMLTDNLDVDQYDPVFSPDGQQIAYTQRPADAVSAAGFGLTGIVVAAADNSNPQVISGPSPDDFGPDWGVDEPAEPGLQLIWGDNDCADGAGPPDALLAFRFEAGLEAPTPGACPDLGQTVNVIDASEHTW